jgi:hypothetical protein
MSDFVSELIAIGGRSLEQDEEYLKSVFARKGEVGGLLRVNVDVVICYYQIVFARVILPKYRAKLQFRYEGRREGELAIKRGRNRYFLVLDHWREDTTAPIQKNVDDLATRNEKDEACLVVFSANADGETEERLALIDGLPGIGDRAGAHRIRTRNEKGEDCEFWIVGWHVPRRPSDGPQEGEGERAR